MSAGISDLAGRKICMNRIPACPWEEQFRRKILKNRKAAFVAANSIMRKFLYLISLVPVSMLSLNAQTVVSDSSGGMQITSDMDSVHVTAGDSTWAFSNTDLGDMFYDKGIEAARQANYTEALSDFQTALLYEPGNGDILYNLGLTEYYLKAYAEALGDFDAALAADSANARIYNQEGLCYAMLGNYEKAERNFSIMLHLDSEFPMGNYNFGILKLEEGDTEAACSLLHKAESLGYGDASQVIQQYCGN